MLLRNTVKLVQDTQNYTLSVLYGTYTIIKKACQGKDVAFLRPGPMLTPKHNWGPRADSGLPTVGQDNAAFEETP